MTQAELADAAGVTRQTVVAVEAGDYAPSVYLALAIAQRLGGTVEQLFETGLAQHGERSLGRAAGRRHACAQRCRWFTAFERHFRRTECGFQGQQPRRRGFEAFGNGGVLERFHK